MYKELQKRKYLENCIYEDTTTELIMSMFEKSELIEKQYNLDLADFNNDQIDILINSLYKTARIQATCCRYFANYYSWCLAEGLLVVPNEVNPYTIKTGTIYY